ncbi:AAA family ATPase [Nocardia sp. NPDC058666]|uniref:AAA family ATPase n=1 Tax=unclassified Nocardia TaxID=2637762 RepID=UPI003648A498
MPTPPPGAGSASIDKLCPPTTPVDLTFLGTLAWFSRVAEIDRAEAIRGVDVMRSHRRTPSRELSPVEAWWLDGVNHLDHGDLARAEASFATAVQHDPTAADVWLGMHAVGLRRDEAIKAMASHSGSFGALRSKFGRNLSSRFDLGFYVTYGLETQAHLWLAVVAKLLRDGKLDSAAQFLAATTVDDDPVRLLRTRHAFMSQDWTVVLTSSHGVTDEFIRDEVELYAAMALLAQQIFDEALDVLSKLPRAMHAERVFQAEIRVIRGLSNEALGRKELAQRDFQAAYRYAPEFPGLLDKIVPTNLVAVPTLSPVPVTSPVPVGPAQVPSIAAEPHVRDREKLLADALARLDAMIGLEPVKQQIQSLVAQVRMAQVRRSRGIAADPALQHFVFVGPPGTGKTTVARILGDIFAGLGLLERGHLIEAQRLDLVGQVLGATAVKATAVIDSALDGVLFIDEAYALNNKGYLGGDAFGNEALQVLLKRAEDDRHRLVVILAGYPREIAEMLASNPGLASRFTTKVDFPSYSPTDLTAIAQAVLHSHGNVAGDEATKALHRCFKHVVAAGVVDDLGNGRLARELCAKAAAVRDLRLSRSLDGGEPSNEEIVAIEAPDIEAAYNELVRTHVETGPPDGSDPSPMPPFAS